MHTRLESGARSGAQELAQAKAYIQQLEMELEGYHRGKTAPSPSAVATIKQLEDEVVGLKNDIVHYEREQEAISGDLSRARLQVDKLHQKNETLHRQVEKFKVIGDESQSLRAQNQALGDEVIARDRTIAELTRKLNAAPKVPRPSPSALAALQSDNKALCDRIQVLEADLEQARLLTLVLETTEDLRAVAPDPMGASLAGIVGYADALEAAEQYHSLLATLQDQIRSLELELDERSTASTDPGNANQRPWSRGALVAAATAILIVGCLFGLVAGIALRERASESASAHAVTPAASVLTAAVETKPSVAAAATEQPEVVQVGALLSSGVGVETPLTTPTSSPSSTGVAESSATPPSTVPPTAPPALEPILANTIVTATGAATLEVMLPTVIPVSMPAVPPAAASQIFQHNAVGEEMTGSGHIEKLGAGGDIHLVALAGQQVIFVRLLRPAYPAGDPPLEAGQVVRFRGTIAETGAGQEVHVTLRDAVIELEIELDVQNAPSPSE